MCRLKDDRFQKKFFYIKKRVLLQYINKFLFTKLTILIFEFLKEFCYLFLKHVFREIPQIFWNTIPDFRSD